MTTRNTVKRAFRFEAWGTDLVLQRELKKQADLAVVQEVSRGPGRIHLQAYLDQKKGRMLVFSPGGKQLADLKVSDTRPAALPGLSLANSEWRRAPGLAADQPVERRDSPRGAARPGTHPPRRRLDHLRPTDRVSTPPRRNFSSRPRRAQLRVPENQVSSVFLSVPRAEAPRMMRAVYHDGSRVSGELVKVEDGVLAFTVPGIQEPLRLPLAGLRSLVVLRHEDPDGKGKKTKEKRYCKAGSSPPGRANKT